MVLSDLRGNLKSIKLYIISRFLIKGVVESGNILYIQVLAFGFFLINLSLECN